ncbi:MAG: hypothetical protein J5898_11980 [Lachnospiraceae bacterium]|nr:hypothetical protein [Lachnospiraceae bacterium]
MTKKNLPDGVFTAARKDGTVYFRASLTYRRKHISLGSFQTAEEASRAYREGLFLLSDASASLISHTGDAALSFEKWVVLINFRDNGIYFGKPIYLGQKMFFYYLSQSKILKFDLDDLFYFSSHKIMCRGNHFFVADYGMQVSVSGRFGIKNYAVPGRDYLFLNGDPLDFRRVNLRILNTYQGVSETIKKGQCFYTARIHIHGNYVIGRYHTPLEAAIAYNKAVDILKKNGVTKAFQPNYIEGISPSSYADLYTTLKISPKIINYRPESSYFSE